MIWLQRAWLNRPHFVVADRPSLSPCKCKILAAADVSLIPAAFTPLRWLLPYLPPLLVAQDSQFGGVSHVSRRSLRRQFSQSCQF
jgi:hypothetical protein